MAQLAILHKTAQSTHLWLLRQIKNIFCLLDHPDNLIKQKAVTLLSLVVREEPRIMNKAVPKLMTMLLHSQSISMIFHFLKFFISNAFVFGKGEETGPAFPETHIFLDTFRSTLVNKIQLFFKKKDNNLIFLGIDLLNRFTLKLSNLHAHKEAFGVFTRRVRIETILEVLNINQSKVLELLELKLPLKFKHKICEILLRMFRYQAQVDVTPEMVSNFEDISLRTGVLFWRQRGLRSLVPDYIGILRVFRQKNVEIGGFLDLFVDHHFIEFTRASDTFKIEDFKMTYAFLLENLDVDKDSDLSKVLSEICDFLSVLISSAYQFLYHTKRDFKFFGKKEESGPLGESHFSKTFDKQNSQNFLNLFCSVFFNLFNALSSKNDQIDLKTFVESKKEKLKAIITFITDQKDHLSEFSKARVKLILFRFRNKLQSSSEVDFVDDQLMKFGGVRQLTTKFDQLEFLLN